MGIWVLGWIFPVWADVSSNFELRSSQYVNGGNSSFRDGAEASSNSFKLATRGEKKFRRFPQFHWDLETEYSASENWNYFRPREAYLSAAGFSLGRKKITWSQWENKWNQALFEPRFMDDKLRSPTGGLTGLFYERQQEKLNWRVGLLPVFIPEMGPHAYTQGTQFASKNPWFKPPTPSFKYNGVDTPIIYSLDHPELEEVIMNPGGVAQAEWKPTDRTFSRLSYAYKPMPQLLLAFPLDRQVKTSGEMMIDVKPRVQYHHVANYDIAYGREKNDFALSLAAEWPIRDRVPATWQTQEATNALIAAGSYAWWVDSRRSTSLEFSALKVWGGDATDRGDVETSQSLFERRYQFSEALGLTFAKRWSRYESRVKVIFDRLQSGAVYSADFTAHLQSRLSFQLACDFFGLLESPPRVRDFIHNYRGNDRVSMGMSYVF